MPRATGSERGADGSFYSMAEKLHIVESLGEQRLVLPARVNAALTPNDRAKYYFTLLQAAVAHAEYPERPAPDLRQERLACGVTDDGGSDALTGSTKVGPGEYLIPGAARIASTLFGEVELMPCPLEGERGADLSRRLDQLKRTRGIPGDNVKPRRSKISPPAPRKR